MIDGEKVERMGDRIRDSHRCRCFQPFENSIVSILFLLFFFFFFFLLLAAFESGNKRGRKEKEKREGKKNDRCSLNANISFRRVIGPDVFEEITREP